MNLIQALNNGYNLLKSNKIISYKIDAELLLCDTLNVTKEQLILNLQRVINYEDYNEFLLKIKRRNTNEPIAYILNKKEFWKNNFYVNKNVLIPRPETEHLVEEALSIVSTNQKKKLLEIGIGSGCLITSILKDRIECSAVGIDSCKKSYKNSKKECKFTSNRK